MIKKHPILKISYFVIIISALVCMISFNFSDIIITTRSSHYLLDAIFSLDFYGDYMPESSFYIPIHLTFAIWNLPIWILTKFGLTTSTSYLSIVWSKILILLAFLGIINFIRRIFNNLNVRNVNKWLCLIASSLFVFVPIFDLSQYDAFCLFFAFWGIDRLVSQDKFDVWTLLIFSVSISYKVLFVFGIMCFILIKEKRIIRIIPMTLSLVIVPLIFNAFFRYLKFTHDKTVSGLLLHYSYKLLENTISGGTEMISLFFVALFAILIYTFEKEEAHSTVDFMRKASWSIYSIYFLMYVFGVKIHPQWCIFLGFFIIIDIALCNNKKTKNIFLYETCLEVTLYLQFTNFYPDIFFNEHRLDDGIFGKVNTHIFSIDNKESIASIIETYDFARFMPIVAALFVVIGLVIMIKTNPYKDNANAGEAIEEIESIDNYLLVKDIIIIGYLLLYVAIRFLI